MLRGGRSRTGPTDLLLVGAVVLVVCALSTPVSLGAAPAPAAQAPVGVITLPPHTPTTPQPAIATPLGVRPAGATPATAPSLLPPPVTASPTPSPAPPATLPATPTPPPTVTPAPREAYRGTGQWVTNTRPLEMWSSPEPDAVSLGTARPGSYFELTGAGTEQRLFVYSPRLEEYAWIDADAVSPAEGPPSPAATGPPRLGTINLPGRSLAYTVRSWPRVAPETRIRELAHNTPVFVSEAVRGDDGAVWYRIGEDEYVHSDGIRLPKGPPLMYAGRWIDVDLSEPTLMTAYEDDRIVYTALALRGTTMDATPKGLYRILRRVENETMDSATLGIPRDAPGGYYLENVLYTQYFTNDGAAIHYNYWSQHFGYAGTHGCLGVNLEDALWFWNWASVGTPLHIHD
jgi:hypothetical protein